MHIRNLLPTDASQFHALRLRGLKEAPTSFASSYEEEVGISLEEVGRRLSAKPDGATFGAFDTTGLVGVAGLQREGMRKLAHKAFIWGMYLAPEARRQGVGRKLLQHALEYAWNSLSVTQVNLGLNTGNTPAVELYKSLGFETYGVERGFLLVDGVLYDEYQMVCASVKAAGLRV